MHVLQIVILYCIANYAKGYNEELCLIKNVRKMYKLIKISEYKNLQISYAREVKRLCKSGPSKIILSKNGIIIKKEFLKKTRNIRLSLTFNAVTKMDSGNYTLFFSNSKFNLTYFVELIVTNGSLQSKSIHENTIPYTSNIIKGRVYWMPIMSEIKEIDLIRPYRNHSINCWFFSTENISRTTVKWYFKHFSIEEITQMDSRIQTTLMNTDCEYDSFMPQVKGLCYVTTLHFCPFLPIDTGEYKCQINRSLTAEFSLMEEVTQYHRILIDRNENGQKNLAKERLTFNQNDTVCAGARYSFECKSVFTAEIMSLWFLDKSSPNYTLLSSSSESRLSNHINRTQSSDSGWYLCIHGTNNQRRMFLTVTQCRLNTVTIFIVLCAGVVLMIGVSVAFFCHRITLHRQLYLHNKIHSFTNPNAETVHRNEHYIPLIRDLNWEVPRKNLKVSQEVLGAGEFGTVFRGMLKNQPVAVKVAKYGGAEMLAQEIKVMQRLGSHPNVIRLLGICSWNEPMMAILELADRGSLWRHLRDHNPQLFPYCEEIGLEQLLSFVTQIATGMQFLASKQVIHRDLAARNCLLTEDMCVKLSDFGLTRVTASYNDTGDPFQEDKAVAWVAPEVLTGNEITSKSDVWSFGVVMWEVFQLGACPYPGMSSLEVQEAVMRGQINSQPSLATDGIYLIMVRCWALAANDRPSFTEVREALDVVEVNEYL